ncbi:hypothetical protein [Paenibacillus eucommiae]|uniref:Uncharacterized protein n=1 Tax=Paenibacillus eucommiae TaxID=1355755 RepID=A0ABS4IT37_9BACL|nr:hypothetical protein [Paenibacillus eucommiae]MBP1990739.1 hypothetical protein [Paenibacillus eucommiae]
MTVRLVVITEAESDLLGILRGLVPSLAVLKPGEITSGALQGCDAIAILGGATSQPIQFRPGERVIVEQHVRKGTRILAEFCTSIGSMFASAPESTRYERIAFVSLDTAIEGVAIGDLLDDQSGLRMKPHAATCASGVPILQYVKQHAHDRVEVTDEIRSEIAERALWFEQPDNVLVCSFRLANFLRARFSPQGRVQAVIEYIVGWLLGEQVKLGELPHAYETGHYNPDEPLAPQVQRSALLAMQWFRDAGILLDDGKGGVEEGIASEIYHNGEQRMFQWIRSDCIGEVAMSYTMDYLLTGKRESLDISNSLAGVIFNSMQCKDEGDLHGMIRWTDEQWNVCYQDDVARAIVPELLKHVFVGHSDYLQECMHALDFLIRTTGTDGTRFYCTYNSLLSPKEIARLNGTPGDMPSAHFNAYYHAALLLAYKLTGKTEYREVAVRGLTTIMSAYPVTFRVLSQTQEYSRLIYPLSWLYWITGDDEHRDWLYRVSNDLQQFKHPSGAYLEWDEGYTAMMRRKIGEDENSLLAVNGDCVADLLYTNNWLPFAWMQAYWVTKDPFFLEQWNDTAKFLVSAQLHSKYAKINGGWARAFDPEKKEVFGSPADNSWGPWAIESGWTVAEISSGLMMGLLDERLSSFFGK